MNPDLAYELFNHAVLRIALLEVRDQKQMLEAMRPWIQKMDFDHYLPIHDTVLNVRILLEADSPTAVSDLSPESAGPDTAIPGDASNAHRAPVDHGRGGGAHVRRLCSAAAHCCTTGRERAARRGLPAESCPPQGRPSYRINPAICDYKTSISFAVHKSSVSLQSCLLLKEHAATPRVPWTGKEDLYVPREDGAARNGRGPRERALLPQEARIPEEDLLYSARSISFAHICSFIIHRAM